MNISMASVTKSARKLPMRVGYNAVAGFGKTSVWAFAKNPVFLMAKGETGLETLVGAKQVPEVSHFPELTHWGEVTEAAKALLREDHDFKTLVLDAGGGFEAMLHDFVCNDQFKGEWGEKGFMSFMRGYEVSLPHWQSWLDQLDDLRTQRGMSIILLNHVHVKPYNNPDGENYDRYVPVLHQKTWALTERWLDVVLFGTWYTPLDTSGSKAKVRGTHKRFVYTQRHAAYDAKNRLGLPPEIVLPDDGPEAAYKTIVEAFKA